MLAKLFRVALLIPAAYWIFLIFFGDLGADPAKKMVHLTGEMSLYYLLFNLVIGALVALSIRFPKSLRFLLQNRRFLGVVTFIYLIFHLMLYLVTEGFESKAFVQMISKTYLIFATMAWLILFVAALTSNDYSVRRLGSKKWKRIHRFIHLATAFVTVHVLLIEKTDLIKYGIIFSALWSLQTYRAIKKMRTKRIPRGPVS